MKLVASRKLRYSQTDRFTASGVARAEQPRRGEHRMSSKENAAVGQLLAVLEARYALRVLWALRDGHPQTFRLLQDSVGGITPNTMNTRLKDLRAAGLVGHGGDGYSLTASGADLVKRLSDIQAFAGRWATAQARKKA
jgi:DNA-binding HxlR family transcriptional regulator